MRFLVAVMRGLLGLLLPIGSVLAGATAPPDLPEAEKAIQNDVDHWGVAFADQFRAFKNQFDTFEKKAGQGSLDYVLGVETSLRKTFPTKYWFKGQFANEVELRAGRNESEAFQLAIMPKVGFELNDVQVNVSDFVKRGEGNASVTIPADAFKLWRVGFIETKQPRYPTRYVGLWPDPLMELEPFSIGGVDLGLIWCEIKVPAEASPGDYRGTITVRASNSHELKLTVKLHVWDFVLPDRVPMPMLAWTRPLRDEQYYPYCELLLSHHVDPIRMGFIKDPQKRDEVLEFCFKRGLTYFECMRSKNEEKFKAYYEHIKSKGWLDKAIIYGGRDEPLKEQFEEIVVPYAEKLRKNFPGIQIFLASQYYEGMKRGCDFLLLDVSTNFHSWLEAGRPGKQQLWWYFCNLPIQAEFERPLSDAPLMVTDRDAIEHRVVYWMAHHYGVKGMFVYGGSLWPKGNENWPAEPFKVNESLPYPYGGIHNGNGFVIYPGPRPSIRLKNIRDGAEDYWYLTQVAKLAQSSDYAKGAQSLLDQLRPTVFVDTHYFNRRPEVMLDFRDRLGHFIEQASRSR